MSTETLSLEVMMRDHGAAALVTALRAEIRGLATEVRALGNSNAGNTGSQQFRHLNAGITSVRTGLNETRVSLRAYNSTLSTSATSTANSANRMGSAMQRAANQARAWGQAQQQAAGNGRTFNSTIVQSTNQLRAHTAGMEQDTVAIRGHGNAARLATTGVRSHGNASRIAAGEVRQHGTASSSAAAKVQEHGAASRTASAGVKQLGTASTAAAGQVATSSAEMVASMARVVAAMDAASARMATGFRRSAPAMGAAGAAAGKSFSDRMQSEIRGGMGKVKGMLTNSGSMLGLAGVFGVGALGKAGIDRLSTIENAEMAFTTQLGTKRMAKDFSKELLAFAKTTPFAFTDVANQARNLMAFGLPESKVIPTITAVGNSAASGGTGTTGMNAIGTALGKILSQGQIYADDINSLAVNGVQARQFLANAYNTDGAGLRKMMMDGAIDGQSAVNIIVDGIQNGSEGQMGKFASLDGLMKNMKKTWSGNLSDFKATVTSSMANIMEPALPGLKAGVQKVGDVFKSLPKGIENVKAYAAAPLAAVGAGIGAVVSAGGGLLGWLNSLPGPLKAVLIGLTAFLVAGRGLAQSLGKNVALGRQNWAFASYGQGTTALLRLRTAYDGTARVVRNFGHAFTSAGIAEQRVRGFVNSGIRDMTRFQAVTRGIGQSFTGVAGSVAAGARNMGKSLLGALGGGWGIAIMGAITLLSLWINKQGEAARAEKAHAEQVAALAATMNQVTGDVTSDTRRRTADAWSSDGQFAKIDAQGINSQLVFDGVINGGPALDAARDEIRGRAAAILETTEAWKNYGAEAKRAGLSSRDLIMASEETSLGGSDAYAANNKRILAMFRETGVESDSATKHVYDLMTQGNAAYGQVQGTMELLNNSSRDVIKGQENTADAFKKTVLSAANNAGIVNEKLLPAITATANKRKSIESIFDSVGVKDSGQRATFIEQMSADLVKGADDMHYFDSEAANAAQSVTSVGEAVKGADGFFKAFFSTNRKGFAESQEGLDKYLQAVAQMSVDKWQARTENPYVQEMAAIANSADAAINRVDALRRAMDDALGIRRSSEDLAVDYFAGIESLRDGFKDATQKSGGNIEAIMGDKGDWDVSAPGSMGDAARTGYKNQADFRKLLDARILDAGDRVPGGITNYDAALKAMQEAQQQGKADYLNAAASSGVDPGKANAAWNRDYDADGGQDRHIKLILDQATQAKFESDLGVAMDGAGDLATDKMQAAISYVVDWAASQNMTSPADLDTAAWLSKYAGLKALAQETMWMKLMAEAQLIVSTTVTGGASNLGGASANPGTAPSSAAKTKTGNNGFILDGGHKHMANGGVTGRQAMIANAGSWITWAEDETGGELYAPFARSKRSRTNRLMKEGAARIGGAFISEDELRGGRKMANGGVLAPPRPLAPLSAPGGVGGGNVTIAAGAVTIALQGNANVDEHELAGIAADRIAATVREILRENEGRRL
ncbi:hypothetical protein D1871_11125 [Nakamurella silvestris]|nr:hypothetical protein D1871_11125 [Nakamurella silvestris]